MALLETKELHTYFKTRRGIVKAVNGVSYSIEPGKTLGIVGESGSGKSVSAMSILRLLDGNGYIDSGEILFEGKDLTKIPMSEMYHIRGNKISVIFQEPMTALNPVFSVERQLSEPFMIHRGMNKKEAAKAAVKMLADVKIPNPEVVVKQYPHQLSGGMRQRVMIAMAMITHPKLLIADEPTTALDVTIQAQILQLMQDLQKQMGMSIILITHDLGIVADVADEIVVMYAGKVVEKGSYRDIFYNLRHPYTWSLLQSVPKISMDRKKELASIEGGLPDMVNLPEGCAFCSRCPFAMNVCTMYQPPVTKLDGLHEASCWLLDERADTSHVPFMKEGK